MAAWPYSTARWQRLRRLKLNASPVCEPCHKRGVLRVATVVDHITAVAAGGDPFPPLDGLMAMCPSCHSLKTNAKDNPHAFGGGGGIAFPGCDTDGLPVDPSHPFLGGIGGARTGSG